MSINLDRTKDASSIKLDKLTFEQFIDFVFNRTQETECGFDEYKFGETKVTAEYLIKLFRNPKFLLENFNSEQIEEGFELITELLCFVKFDGLLWDIRLPFSLREELISSMFDLFSKLFANNSFETIDFMWWDILAYGYSMENGSSEDEDGAKVQRVMFETLKRILEIESEECQKSALHGLGHLKHSETEKTINDFLRRHPVDSDLREYAISCINGTMP
jgi:hypothetical protein